MESAQRTLFNHVHELIEGARAAEKPWLERRAHAREAADDLYRRLVEDFRALTQGNPSYFQLVEVEVPDPYLHSVIFTWKVTKPERCLQVVLDTDEGDVTVAGLRPGTTPSAWFRLHEPRETTPEGTMDLTEGLIAVLADQSSWQLGSCPPLPGELVPARADQRVWPEPPPAGVHIAA